MPDLEKDLRNYYKVLKRLRKKFDLQLILYLKNFRDIIRSC